MVTPLTPPSTLAAALTRILKPIVRLALAHGITYPAFAELLKMLFVDVARHHFSLPETIPSDSRLHLLTGIHRKELKRLRGIPSDPAGTGQTPESVSLGAQLVGLWIAKAPYLDPQGRPRPLPRLASASAGASFESLVASVSKDIRSRVVLDEWLRLGIATLNERDEVVLSTGSFVPRAGFDEIVFYFGHNLHDHAAASVHNLLGETPPLLERSVHYDALSPESISELEALTKRLSVESLQQVNSKAIALEERDAVNGQNRQRFTYGIYFYSEPTPLEGKEPS
ncbi:MAG: hypothetical protein KDI50_00635 [Candidatus Competibacteraceae bacterium]|nr:hypothetical protein [Candidatus Competibacteraceae bacterium]